MSEPSSNELYHPSPLWQDILPGGHHWSARIRKGTVLVFTTTSSNANLSALFYNAEEKLERYNMPDTLKAQHTVFLSKGHVCYSDMGRILCSIVKDDTGWNDTICGVTDSNRVEQRYGTKNFEQARNGMYRNGLDGLLVEMGKWGLSLRDLVANVNFFSKVTINDNGQLQYHPEHSQVQQQIAIRFEMDTLVVLSAAPHPLSAQPTYQPAAIKITAHQAYPIQPNDVCLTSCEQNGRGFINTFKYTGDFPASLPEFKHEH